MNINFNKYIDKIDSMCQITTEHFFLKKKELQTCHMSVKTKFTYSQTDNSISWSLLAASPSNCLLYYHIFNRTKVQLCSLTIVIWSPPKQWALVNCYEMVQVDVHYSLVCLNCKIFRERLVLRAVSYLIEKVVECWESLLFGKVTGCPKYNNRETPLLRRKV